MQVDCQNHRKEVVDLVMYDDILFVLFHEGSIRGVDMNRFLDSAQGNVCLFTPEELYNAGVAVFCVLWDGADKLLRDEITLKEDGIYVRYGGRVHKSLNTLYHESMLAECYRLWR